jgi:hypothetical protein
MPSKSIAQKQISLAIEDSLIESLRYMKKLSKIIQKQSLSAQLVKNILY